MPKRKREEDEEKIDRIQDRAIRIKASRLRAKIDHGNKSLKAALQLARGFERQKLGRRQKQASEQPHTLLRLREEVIILKELDVGKTGQQYLFKQLVKTKRIKESAAFVALYGDDAKVDAVKSTAEGNVLGRLIKANPVKEVLPGILKDIRDVLGIDKPGAREPKQEKNQTDLAMKTSEVKDNIQVFAGFSDAEGEDDGTEAVSKVQLRNASEIVDVLSEDNSDEIDYTAFNSRIAASSDESDDDDDFEDSRSAMRTNSNLDNDQISDSVSVSGSEMSDMPTISRPKAEKTKSAPQSLTSTAFLPSLSMGGYYSGSESDIDDGFDHERGPPIKQERKNRRGQRARQQIAEKKYGKEAKHLANQKLNEKKSRNDGWDARKGAVGGDDRRRGKGLGGGRFGNRSTAPTGANGDAIGSRAKGPKKDTKKADGPLHPSWEAAKKRKEEGGKIEFAGKKITFD